MNKNKKGAKSPWCATGILILLALNLSFGQSTKSALFLGNSYTFTGDIPGLVTELAEAAGDSLLYEMYAPGGRRIDQHATDSASLNRIASRQWDYVSKQAQSIGNALDTIRIWSIQLIYRT